MKLLFKTLAMGLAIVLFGITVAGATVYFITENAVTADNAESENSQNSFVTKAVYGGTAIGERVDLTDAAEKSVQAVEPIKSTQKGRTQTVRRMPDIYDFFFGDGELGNANGTVMTPEAWNYVIYIGIFVAICLAYVIFRYARKRCFPKSFGQSKV